MYCQYVLVAEDNDDIRGALVDVIGNEGYEVHAAKNGREALNILKIKQGPALVLLDLMMPVMSGWEFLDAQKSQAVLMAHPVVTVSAVGATQSLQDPTPLATAGALQKPIELEVVLEKVREFCGPAPMTGLHRAAFAEDPSQTIVS